RRLDAIAKTVNQIAKTQKLPAKHINQGFFDPSTGDSAAADTISCTGDIRIRPFLVTANLAMHALDPDLCAA
ncbi:hypothetical protein, partial [Novacetimonas maltaceti]